MNLYDSSQLAIELIKEHKLWNWTFKWHKQKTAFGTCNHTNQIILLSEELVPLMEFNAVKNTILHEIAHALVGPGNGHNHIWRRKAIEIGCDGNRTNNYASVNENFEAKYIAVCSSCGRKHSMHRKPKRNYSCRCDGRIYNTELKLDYIQQY